MGSFENAVMLEADAYGVDSVLPSEGWGAGKARVDNVPECEALLSLVSGVAWMLQIPGRYVSS